MIAQLFEAEATGDVLSVCTDYGEDRPPPDRILDAPRAGGPRLDPGTWPVSRIAPLIGRPTGVVGFKQNDPAGVHGQLAVSMAGETGALATMATTMPGFTPATAAIVGPEGSIRFTTELNLPGGVELWSRDRSPRRTYEEPATRQFEGLCFGAAEVTRCMAADKTLPPAGRSLTRP